MSDLVPCKTCKKEVAKTAKTCPHCGVSKPNAKATSPTGNETLDGCLGIVVLFIIIAIIMYSCSGEDRTPEEIAQDKIERENEDCKSTTMAGIMSKDFIKQNLKSPATADFPFVPTSVTYLGNCVHVVKSYVDSQNGFGATVRSNTIVKVQYIKSMDTWVAQEVVIK